MSKTPPQKIVKSFDASFYRVSGCFSAVGVQKHYKRRFTKKPCRKALQKNRPEIENRFFSVLFCHVFERLSVCEGISKTPLKKAYGEWEMGVQTPFKKKGPLTYHARAYLPTGTAPAEKKSYLERNTAA
jgi:hypothetical protein